MAADKLSQAIALVKAGKKDEARRILVQIVREDLHNEAAWIWLVEVLPTDSQRIATLEQWLKNNPNSQAARRALDNLRTRQAPPAPIPTTDETLKPLLQAIRRPPAPPLPLPETPPAANKPTPGPSLTVPEGKPAAPQLVAPAPIEAAPVAKPITLEPPPAVPPQQVPESPVPPDASIRPEEQATPVPPPPKKGARLNALDICAIVLISLIAIATAGYLLWINYGPSITGQQALADNTRLAATNAMLATQNAEIKTTLTAALNAGPTRASPPTLTLSPTASPTLGFTPAAISLPAPVYFISGLLGGDAQNPVPGSYQVWRLETNGLTLTQITSEPAPVDALDVSPSDGTLAYISDNQLILTDASGKNRRILAGSPLPADSSGNISTTQVSSPAWSPDGKQLAYGLNGVNVLDVGADNTSSLIKNNIPPADKPLEIRLYEPRSWSPDGTKILTLARGNKCGSMTILPAAGGKPTASFNEENDLFTWSDDSQSLLSANPVPGGLCGGYGGLWRVDASTGKATALVANQPDASVFSLFGWPKLSPDGKLFYFYAEGQAAALNGQTFSHTLYSSETDGVTGRTAIGSETFYFFDETQYLASGSGAFGDVLWSLDGSFALVSAARAAGTPQEIWLVRTDGRSAVKLAGVPGTHLRWGVLAP